MEKVIAGVTVEFKRDLLEIAVEVVGLFDRIACPSGGQRGGKDDPPTDCERGLPPGARLGRDLEAHAAQIHSNPANYDRVCDYVAAQMAALAEQLRAMVLRS